IEGSWKYPVMIAGIFIYMFFSFDFMDVFYPLYSVSTYIAVYSGQWQLILFILLYSFSALNLISFILYCIQMIREQKNTIDEINRLYQKLAKANDELRQYADIKEKMGETKERNRLAMEIHDTLGHSLTGISVGVDTCIAIMDTNPTVAKAQLKVISGVAKNGIADIRRSVSTLQNDLPKHTTLEQNIRDMISKAQKATGTHISFNTVTELHFEDDEENAIFRVIQESVTNAIRHGHAKKIDVTISRKDNKLKIIISDNGVGCDSFVSGFGTTHMKERVAMLDGSIDFISHNGFTVIADIPLRQDEKHD
ncbi:MAG: sensor histidine kinase, partial [Treponema sp.]|nr:sensor histidine kinase [Treponema sp.]